MPRTVARASARKCPRCLGLMLVVWSAATAWTAIRPAAAQVPVTAGGADGGGFRRTVPTDFYFGVLGNLYSGDYRDALDGFQSCLRSGVKNGTNFWIDSICYHTMCGECYFQMGQFAPALDHYNKALQLFTAFNDWMIPVHFTPGINPLSQQPATRLVPWGRTQRQSVLGSFSDTVLIRQGRIDQSAVVQRGGVVQQAVEFPINPQEIVRCTCLALRRRRDILGPLAPHDVLAKQVVTVLSKRPVQPNHWSEAWIDVQLGCAFAALANDAQAKPLLEKSIVTGGQFDHPLTSIALVELGRIALAGGDYDLATKYFQEASFSAFYFYDPLVIEDALAGAALAHVSANRPGPLGPLSPAADWARKEDLGQLQVTLIQAAAEMECLQDRPKNAQTMLDNARVVVGRRDLGKFRAGARLNHTQALASYQQGNLAAGDAAVNAALTFMQTGSLRLFQMALTERLTADRSLTPRMARDVWQVLLRDPLPTDWAVDPLETLTTLAVPHVNYFERWLELSLESKELDGRRALEISDLAKRHRFLSVQELGGRLLNLRWLLEGPAESLSQQTTLQRQALFTQFPAYEKLSRQAASLRADLAQLPLVSEDPAIVKQQAGKLAELDKVVRDQEMLLKVMALRRAAADLVFPPQRSVEDVQKALPPNHAVLTFFVGQRGMLGFLMTNDKFGYWPIANPAEAQKKLVGVLQAMGNYDDNRPLSADDLKSDAWRAAGRELLDLLTKDSKASLPYGFRELTVVPDGFVWYVPFDALCAAPQGGPLRPLLEQTRMRYAPTLGLAAGDRRPRLDTGKTLVSLGRLYPTDDEAVAETAFAELSRSVPQSAALKLKGHKTAAGGALFASLADRLIVLTDTLPSPQGPQMWSPLTGEKTAPGGTLGDWLRLPWHGPEHVVLPGFHTAAENGLKKLSPAETGADLFLATTGLMAGGARTILIGRWRPGGRTSFDLVREFMQELPFAEASTAWQRSVLLARRTPIARAEEPRVQSSTNDADAPTPDHPFFWGGFLVVDTGTEPAGKAEEAVKEVLPAAPKKAEPQPVAPAAAPKPAAEAN